MQNATAVRQMINSKVNAHCVEAMYGNIGIPIQVWNNHSHCIDSNCVIFMRSFLSIMHPYQTSFFCIVVELMFNLISIQLLGGIACRAIGISSYPIDFDRTHFLISRETNHASAQQFSGDIQKYLRLGCHKCYVSPLH